MVMSLVSGKFRLAGFSSVRSPGSWLVVARASRVLEHQYRVAIEDGIHISDCRIKINSMNPNSKFIPSESIYKVKTTTRRLEIVCFLNSEPHDCQSPAQMTFLNSGFLNIWVQSLLHAKVLPLIFFGRRVRGQGGGIFGVLVHMITIRVCTAAAGVLPVFVPCVTNSMNCMSKLCLDSSLSVSKTEVECFEPR